MVSYTAMRTIFYLLILFVFLGCKKDQSTEGQVTGTWFFKEGIYGTGGPPTTPIKADPAHPVKLLFRKDGSFFIDELPRLTSFQVRLNEDHYDRYQLLPNNQIRFYSSTNKEEFICDIELGKELKIHQLYCREGCSDFFARKY